MFSYDSPFFHNWDRDDLEERSWDCRALCCPYWEWPVEALEDRHASNKSHEYMVMYKLVMIVSSILLGTNLNPNGDVLR